MTNTPTAPTPPDAGPPEIGAQDNPAPEVTAALDLHSRGDSEAAREALKARVDANPADLHARMALARVQLDRRRRRPALAHALAAVQLAPARLAPRLLLADALAQFDRTDDALATLDQAAENFPKVAAVPLARGRLLHTLGRLEEAQAAFEAARSHAPDDPDILVNLGVIARAREDVKTAEAVYRQVLEASPDHRLAQMNLANLLAATDRAGDALALMERAHAAAPGDVDAAYNLAAIYARLERHADALALLAPLADRCPGRADIRVNAAISHIARLELTDARAALDAALALDPEDAEATYNLAWLQLLTGEETDGWRNLEARWRLPRFTSRKRVFTVPAWDGTLTPGTGLLLHAEQGMGDAIQYARFARYLSDRGLHVTLQTPRPLIRLFEESGLAHRVIIPGTPLPANVTAHAPLMSLPHLLGLTSAEAPFPQGYLSLPASSPAVSPTLQPAEHFRVGIVWRGSPDNGIDARRSLPLGRLMAALTDLPVEVVSLQVGHGVEELAGHPQILDAGVLVADFADTAGIITQLDMVAGVDTATLHLAAALGTPCAMLLPFSPDYRWSLGTSRSPWYDALTLCRQTRAGDWEDALTALKNCIAQRVEEKPG